MPQFSSRTSLIALIFLLMLVISGQISITISLLLGLLYSLVIGNPFKLETQKTSALVLKLSVVIMGFSLNIKDIFTTLETGFLITILTIAFAIILGLMIGRLLKVEHKLSFLIAGGTAICGGSAIAALAPAIQAKPNQIFISITIVFMLNAIGLLVYPELGYYLQLNQSEFGLWAALGIHDTSSVVGAAAIYGEEALKVATTNKLARALWIIPLVLMAGIFFKNKQSNSKFPLFILFFVAASLIATFLPTLSFAFEYAPLIAKKGMAISLFLIGAGFTKETLKEIELRALWQGISLWLLVSVFSYWLITFS